MELQQFEHRLCSIEARNERVEADKAWEISWARKLLIVVLTYFVVVLFLYSVDIVRPWINAIVPSIGFFLSTLTLPFVKKRWIKKYLSQK
jgi:hypothetical protein